MGAEAVLRRTNARRRREYPALACSGIAGPRRKSGLGALFSGECSLTGVGLSGISFPPVGECWPELSADSYAVLRRTNARRRWGCRALACSGEDNPYGSWCSSPVNALSPELRLPVMVFPPVGECWPELGWFGAAVPPVNEGLVGVRSTDCAPAPA
ncbi:hypothetical protein SAMN05216375_10732 [Trichococcus ilyis]|uniref:Uncharacterized protein n=1 Tax=Trichococcus ilyis TaxID=640938 RepID=A0A143YP86_9LACT|nr:Hypothetical protein TR210_1318 [Trichococcus ilyis]SEJ06598.1 hypothetical protein SAMN05216375_10732 [Trichococcus ilyis]